MGYLYIFLTVLFTVYGQLILKWRINLQGAMPEGLAALTKFWFKLILDPWVLSGLLSAFIASIAWMATLTKFELSYAYPFMSLSFVVVFFMSVLLFNELITIPKVLGLLLVIVGLIILARG
ncbi:DMT family transporter [Aestuariivivens marinum]|uniref:EamA family transporter n=1 Tax=Aestuariivivens marinum TaxID=2913555 RepID=UPI001F5A6141|nr:EamA family transporter [Aestuariivivens marinum]